VQRAVFDHVYAGMKLERFRIRELRKKTMSWETMKVSLLLRELKASLSLVSLSALVSV
jgi:hypothetical protein